jgi:hypothetical protein
MVMVMVGILELVFEISGESVDVGTGGGPVLLEPDCLADPPQLRRALESLVPLKDRQNKPQGSSDQEGDDVDGEEEDEQVHR